MFERIKKWYGQGLWNAQNVHKAVEKGVLTAAQYKEIVGAEYAA